MSASKHAISDVLPILRIYIYIALGKPVTSVTRLMGNDLTCYKMRYKPVTQVLHLCLGFLFSFPERRLQRRIQD